MTPLTREQFEDTFERDQIGAIKLEAFRIADHATSVEDAWTAADAFVKHYVDYNREAGYDDAEMHQHSLKMRSYLAELVEAINPPWLSMLNLDFSPGGDFDFCRPEALDPVAA